MKKWAGIWRIFITSSCFVLLVVGLSRIDVGEDIPVRPVQVLCYHDIALEPSNKWGRTPEELGKDFEALVKNKVEVISLEEFIKDPSADKFSRGQWVAITFDDAAAGQFQYALPLLKKFNFPATFYVPTKAVDKSIPISSSFSGTMTWEELNVLSNAGFQVASHSHSHKSFVKLSPERILHQISRSFELLQDKIGIDSRDLCLPYGKYLPEHEKLLVQAGVRSIALTTTDHGIGDLSLVKIRRFEVKSHTSQEEILDKILGRK